MSEAEQRNVGIFSHNYSRRLIGLLLVGGVAALVVRTLLVPEGFGSLGGHYRGAAPLEEAALAPVHQGKKACARCHALEFDHHERDIHVSVECEDCHGRGDAHVAARSAGAAADQGRMFRNLEQANCLACHRRLLARPKLFPTVDVAEHFQLLGVKDPRTPCQACHDPHRPLFLDREVSQARKHPLIHPCTDCHFDREVEKRPLPEDHVVTFQCKDCHAEIVADYQEKPHRFLDCRACHNFHKESDFSGRIFKNGNPLFCLMCHLEQPFKGDQVPQLKSFEEHREEMATDEADQKKRCVDCHLQKRIHRLPAKTPPRASEDSP